MFFPTAVQADDPRLGIAEDAEDHGIGAEARESVRVPKPPQLS
jgi:hypothetical protein